ncbi:MAG: beta-ketoacyl-ACP synthase II [Candidatus Omnitrophica bacterium]|nr:beta-ketoacyl-ACP synthase II [Candidatus Omnitrophota bacterium]
MERRVVVTGCGVVSPVGSGKQPFWEALCSGRSGIGKITQFDATSFKTQIAGEIKDFAPPDFLSFKDLKRTPRFVQFALKAAQEAIVESGLDFNKLDLYRVGVVIGSGIGDLESIERECKIFLEKGINKISPFLIPMLITNEAAGNVSIYFNLKGVNFCTVTACASGSHAIGEAYLAIKYNRADVVICGGTEACITPMGVGGFCALKALSRRNDKPEEASRPFDKDRDGFVMAEGAGIVVLEELEHAKKRGAFIYGEVCGYGTTSDAYHITAPEPEGEAPAKAMELALKEASVSIDEDIYINAHGTSTELNDKVETKAIKKVFGKNAYKLAINSTKSMIGHTLGAAGAIEFIVCCLTIKNKIVHPTINYLTPDPECDLNYTPNKAIEKDVKIAISNSLGFGGHNASLLLKQFK